MQVAAPKPKAIRRAHPGQGVPVWRASKWPKHRSYVENGERGLGRDHLYSVAAMTNQSGGVVERYRYDTFGNRTILAPDGITTRAVSSYNQQVGFTGRYLDKETGLWYFRARYYSGSLGRFVNRDPYGNQENTLVGFTRKEYHDGYGLYAAYYVPRFTDPTGLAVWSLISGGDLPKIELPRHPGGAPGAEILNKALEVLEGTLNTFKNGVGFYLTDNPHEMITCRTKKAKDDSNCKCCNLAFAPTISLNSLTAAAGFTLTASLVSWEKSDTCKKLGEEKTEFCEPDSIINVKWSLTITLKLDVAGVDASQTYTTPMINSPKKFSCPGDPDAGGGGGGVPPTPPKKGGVLNP